MPRFGKDATGECDAQVCVLIDPSLQAIGGHHFEYALHLLRAAEQAGFEPWLASHRKFRDQAEMPEHWRILPLYQAWDLHQAPHPGRWRVRPSIRRAA